MEASLDRILSLPKDRWEVYSAVIIAFVALGLWLAARRSEGGVQDVPRANGKAHWLWGHELEVYKKEAGQFYTEQMEQAGDVYTMRGGLFYGDILVLTDCTAVSHIFNKYYIWERNAYLRGVISRLVGRGVLWHEGDQHKRQRQLLGPVFTAERVRQMSPEIKVATEKMCAGLQARIQSHTPLGSNAPVTVDLHEWPCRATLDIIGSVGFGHDFGSGESVEAKRFGEVWQKSQDAGLRFSGFVGKLLLRRFPTLANLPVGLFQAQKEVGATIRKLAMKFVDEQAGVLGKPQGRDLLGTLMRANAGGDNALTMSELLDNIVTFVVAGHETSSSITGLIINELSKRPDLQSKLRQELTDFGVEPTYEDHQSNKLPFLDAVVKEGFRFLPPLAEVLRCPNRDDVIPLGTPVMSRSGKLMHHVEAKKGQMIVIPSVTFNRSSSWGDGDVFRPGRWLEPGGVPPPEKVSQVRWNGLLSFIEGPRMCIGYRMAVFEVKHLVASLIRQFEFTPVPDIEIAIRFSNICHPVVRGQEGKGIQLPMQVRLVDA